eukprot:gene19444-26104_t
MASTTDFPFNFPHSRVHRTLSLTCFSDCGESTPVDLVAELKLESHAPEALEAPEAPFLPDGIVKAIARKLCGEPSSLLSLLSMCGVCQHWRKAVQELQPSDCLCFEDFGNAFSSLPMVHKFRKASAVCKEDVFSRAAKLLSGYEEASFLGESISDRVLMNVSDTVGQHLTKINVQDAYNVTDAGLLKLLTTAKGVVSVSIRDLSKNVQEGCGHTPGAPPQQHPQPQLVAEHRVDSCSPPNGPEQAASPRSEIGFQLGVVISKMANLAELEIDGPARI